MKNTKRSLLFSVLALILCCALLAGTTLAWFTDTASTAVNKIQAGNLDVQLLMYDGTDYVDISDDSRAIFGAGSIAQNNNAQTLWEPGKTQVAYLAIKNNGNLDLKYKVDLKVTNPTDGRNLYEVMEYAITPDATNTAPVTAWTSGNSVAEGEQVVANDVSLTAGVTHYFALSVHMKEDAGNQYQGGKVDFDLTVNAGQLSSEKDSFNEAYDIGAEYPQNAQPATPTFTVNTAAQLQAALTPTVTESDTAVVNITDDIQLANGENWTPMDLGTYNLGVHKIVINGNDHTISGLNNALIGYCYFGGVSVEINNLTIANADMTQSATNGLGYGAFVLSADNCASLTLNNCHLKDSTIVALEDVGGLVGYSSTSVFKLTDCSVENCTITGPESVGGLVGTCGYGAVTFSDCETINTNLTSTKSGTYRIGFAIGTVPNAGTVSLSNVTSNGGSATQAGSTGANSGATCTKLIGRSFGNVTGDNSDIIQIQ